MNLYIYNEPVKTHRISPFLHSTFFEYFGSTVYDGIWVGKESPIPNVDGIRKSVIDGCREAGIAAVRWPGGCCADHYHWKDGVGKERKSRIHPIPCPDKIWHHDFGTDEFIHFCRLIGAEPIIVANTATGSPDEFLDWYEYCNGPVETKYGSYRAENGHPEPYNVKYWGIGNTDENVWWIDYNNPVAYAQNYLKFTTAIRELRNDLHIIGLGLSERHYLPGWVGKFLDYVTHRQRQKGPDSLSVHHYIGSAKSRYKECGDAVDFSDENYYFSLDALKYYQKDIDLHRGYISEHTNERFKTTICFDEWSLWHSEATLENGTRQRQTLRDAIFAACTLHLFYRNCDIVEFAMETQLVNLLQSLFETEGPKCYKTPTFYVFKLFKEHLKQTIIPIYQDRPNSMTDCVASISSDGKKLVITMVNKDLHNKQKVNVRLDDMWILDRADILWNPNVRSMNTFEEPYNISDRPVETDIKNSMELPPHSIMRIILRNIGL
ncbi:MAG: alpha-L-arabinofuranosidase C-terminal domain-containing protein [Clostridia bacterium]|jgi:alpha-N-arabinofuranosidase|nr:hypothetical protein [Clostridiaceae bacterium]